MQETDAELVWSDELYTLPQLMAINNFPCIIKVQEGSMGGDSSGGGDSGEIVRIETWTQQERALAVDNKGRYLSIPIPSQNKFKIRKDGQLPDYHSKEVSIEDLVRKQKLPCMVKFARDELQFTTTSDGNVMSMVFQQFAISETYNEKYLLGNYVTLSELYPNVIYLPLYLNIKVSIARGQRNMARHDWVTRERRYALAAQQIEYHKVQTSKEMFLYERETVDRIKSYQQINTSGQFPRGLNINPVMPQGYFTLPMNMSMPLNMSTSLNTKSSGDMDAAPKKPVARSTSFPEFNYEDRRNIPLPPVPTRVSTKRFDAPPTRFGSIKDKIKSEDEMVPIYLELITLQMDSKKEDTTNDNENTDKKDKNYAQESPYANNNPPVSAPVAPMRRSKSLGAQARSLSMIDTPSTIPEEPTTGVSDMIDTVEPHPTNRRMSEPMPQISRTPSVDYTTEYFLSIADIPSDISGMTIEEIGDCLVLLNLGELVQKFKEEQIDGSLLMDLDEDMVVQSFGCTKLTAKKLIRFKNGWRPKGRGHQEIF